MRLRYLRMSHTPDAQLRWFLQIVGCLESSRQEKEWVRDFQEAISQDYLDSLCYQTTVAVNLDSDLSMKNALVLK